MSEGLCWGASLTSTFLTSSSLSIQGKVPSVPSYLGMYVILMYHPCSPEAKLDRIERRREHIRTVSIYGEVWDMVEERALQLAPPPGHSSLIVHRCFPTFFGYFCFVFIHSPYLCSDPPTHRKPNLKPCTTPTHQQDPPARDLDLSVDVESTPLHLPNPPCSCASYLFHILTQAAQCFSP